MRYAAMRPIDVSNGEGIGVALFIQGCSIHCPGCFQPETWDFNGGELFEVNAMNRLLHYLDNPMIARFSILGGEPLEDCNLYDLAKLIHIVKEYKQKIKIWLYTGYTVEQLRERIKNKKYSKYLKYILNNVDVLVAGPFKEELKDPCLKWCGSCNQQIIYNHCHH